MQMLLCLYPEISNGCFGKRIFKRIQDVFGRVFGQGCWKWCPKSCPMEVRGRLKLSILHFQGSGREEKGGRKGVRGGSERGPDLCFFGFGREISITIERCVFSDLQTIYKIVIITLILCVKSIYVLLHKYLQKHGYEFYH